MKKWNNPTIETLELNKTENGFPWWHKEYVDFFGGTTLGCVCNHGHSNTTNGEEQGKGDEEQTSSTSDAVNGNS
ncbi:MAG: hypothetical protein J5717_09435 [Lachnospiraceae bacterium]|nr:hypothetical protein [Lachnospiraceae bacterium]